jgi:hypothetical protein
LERAHNCDVLLLGVGATVALLGDDRLSDAHASHHCDICHNGSSELGGNLDSAETHLVLSTGYFCLRFSKKHSGTDDPLFDAKGTCSWFGGPEGDGVDEDEGRAFFQSVSDALRTYSDMSNRPIRAASRAISMTFSTSPVGGTIVYPA